MRMIFFKLLSPSPTGASIYLAVDTPHRSSDRWNGPRPGRQQHLYQLKHR
jgi:hypothetical protein